MATLLWKEAFRPFLEQAPERTQPLWPLLDAALRAVLQTKPDAASDAMNTVRPLADAMSDDGRETMDEDGAERVLARCFKVLSHVASSGACLAQYMEAEGHCGMYEVITAALWACSASSPLVGEMHDPSIRTAALRMLSHLAGHAAFFEALLQVDASGQLMAHLLVSVLVENAADANFQVSEGAVDALCRLVMAPVPDMKDSSLLHMWTACVSNEAVTAAVLRLFAGRRPAHVAMAAVNVVHRMVCQNGDRKEDVHGLGLCFVMENRLALPLLPLLIHSDRLLRFRMVELVQDVTRADLFSIFVKEKCDAPDDLAVISSLAALLSVDSLAAERMPTVHLALSVQLAGALHTHSAAASAAVIEKLFLPPLLHIRRLLFEPSASGEALTPLPVLPTHFSTVTISKMCTHVLDAISSLLARQQLPWPVAPVTEDGLPDDLPSLVCSLFLYPHFTKNTALALSAIACLDEVTRARPADIRRVTTAQVTLLAVAKDVSRPAVVTEKSLKALAHWLLAYEGDVNPEVEEDVRTALQLLLFSPAWEQRLAAADFLVLLLPSGAWVRRTAGVSSVYSALIRLLEDEEDYVRAAGLTALAEASQYGAALKAMTEGDKLLANFKIVVGMLGDKSDSCRRVALEVCTSWSCHGTLGPRVLSLVEGDADLAMELAGNVKASAEDMDWEVKKRVIVLWKELAQRLFVERGAVGKVAAAFLRITGAVTIVSAMRSDYDRIPRQEAFLALGEVKRTWRSVCPDVDKALAGVQDAVLQEELGVLWAFMQTTDCQREAEECALAAVYPDETDLRVVASELDNPVDCY